MPGLGCGIIRVEHRPEQRDGLESTTEQLAALAASPANGETAIQEAAMSPLAGWENFYVIVGSSAGALTGLTFLAVTLVGEARERGAGQGIAAFTSPTLVHFGAVLFVTAVLSAPWPALVQPALILGLSGLGGVLYTLIVVRRQRRQQVYSLVLEDWLWYAACPLVLYSALLAAATLLPGSPVPALFAIAAVMVLLLFLGLHNAWDLVTYMAAERLPRQEERSETQRDELMR
jgi:hypothetical protein